ncbi:MAG: hypothetical protein ACYS6W_03665 [Planctomycetota bacterium]|jgi:hypothetical protein
MNTQYHSRKRNAQGLYLLSVIAGLTFTLAPLVSSRAAQSPNDNSILLADAIKAFNEKVAKHPIGKDQPLLTEDEVVAAIRAREPQEDPPVSDRLYNAFKQIAQSKRLPKNAEMEELGGAWVPRGDFVFDVWWVRIMFQREDGSTYSFPIRQRMIRSRPYNEVYKEEVFESPGGGRYKKVIPRTLQDDERLKHLPLGPYTVAPCKSLKVNPPDTLGGNLVVPQGPYSHTDQSRTLGGNIEPQDPLAETGELQKLLRTRYDVLKSIAKSLHTGFAAGRIDIKDVRDALTAMAKAKIKLSQTPEERIKAHKKMVSLLTQHEKHVQSLLATGKTNNLELMRAKAEGLKAEIKLQRQRTHL